MKLQNYTYLILIIASLQLSFHIKKNEKWKLVKNKNGVKAYTREVENSDIKQVKVITVIKSTLTAPVAIVRDVKSHTKWIYRCKTAKILKTVAENDHYYYNESIAPWPVKNRDIITHAVITQNKKTKIITISSTGMPDFIKKSDGIVRIQKLKAKWQFTPIKGGFVEISFTLLINLGGEIPAWIVNMAIADGPFETVLNMTKEVQKEKYQNAKYSFIEEM